MKMESLELPEYKEILESIQDGLVVVDKQLRYFYINKKAEDLIGIPAEKLIGKKFTDAFPDHNLNIASLLEKVQDAWSKKKVATLEIPFQPNNSWYHLTVYPLKDKYSIIFRDITKEKQLKEELQNSKDKLDVIFKNVSDGVVIQDATGKMIYANDMAAYMSGYVDANAMLAAPRYALRKRFEIFDQKKNMVPWSESPGGQVLSGRKKSVEAELCFVNKETREEIWVDMKTSLISSSGSHEILALTLYHNITPLKKLEQQKDNFISLVSHELKTPLTVLKVYEQILQKQLLHLDNQNLISTMTKISDNTEKIIELIHSLLDVSRIQEGKLQLHKHTFPLTKLLQEIVEDIQPITDHQISIVYKKDIHVFADRDRIAQVVINFITNAIKYSKDAKRIVLMNAVNTNEVVVSVKDFGEGIPRKDQQEVFKRFYQSNNKTFPGLGLGLYISSEIIKAHNGTIWVESKEGKGSTFYFSLPIKKTPTDAFVLP